jgi:hypothetical protein
MVQGNRIRSCSSCRLRKVRCSRQIPCKSCIRHGCEDSCNGYRLPANLARTLPIQRANNSARRLQLQEIIPSAVKPLEGRQSHNSVGSIDGRTLLESQDALRGVPAGRTQLASDFHGGEPSRRTQSEHAARSVDALHLHNTLEALRNGVRSDPKLPAVTAFGGFSLTPAEKLEWQLYLATLLPPRPQCDKLVSYYFEHVNWIFQAIHGPTFREEYSRFWSTPIADIEFIWLSLLYIIICRSIAYTTPEMRNSAGFVESKEDVPYIYYRLSRQSLHAGEYESHPCVTQLQVFIESQLYWYGMKAVETLNSALGQAVRCAQAIGLDKDTSTSKDLKTEMRHRIWWDICAIDTFQSLNLDRQPLIQSYLSEVPFPQNCDDSDIIASAIYPRPLDQPTVTSMCVFRSKLFKVLNRLYANNGRDLTLFHHVASVDAEIDSILEQYPWYLQPSELSRGDRASEPSATPRYTSTTLPSSFDYLRWQNHIVHNTMCVQRIRMYRPFLWSHFDYCWDKCIDSVEGAFSVYHDMRSADPDGFPSSPKLLAQSYQTFCSAISIAAFLLVERPILPTRIQNDIEVVIQDLKILTGNDHSLPMAVDGRKTLTMLLDAYHAYCRDANIARSIPGKLATPQDSQLQSLVPELYSFMGGRTKTRTYLNRCISTNHFDQAGVSDVTGAENQAGTAAETHPVNVGRSSNATFPNGELEAMNLTNSTISAPAVAAAAVDSIGMPESLFVQGYSNIGDTFSANSATGLDPNLHFEMLSWGLGDYSLVEWNNVFINDENLQRNLARPPDTVHPQRQ